MGKHTTLKVIAGIALLLFGFNFYLNHFYTKYDDRINNSTEVAIEEITPTETTDSTTTTAQDATATTAEFPTIQPVSEELVRATVMNVVDGDTILVKIDGDEYKVRMIGVDTPESVASEDYLELSGKENTTNGKLASDYTASQLYKGMTVYLQSDTSNTDKYDRLLRYVWLTNTVDVYDYKDICTYMYNAILIENGYAEPMTIEPDTAYSELFEYLYDISNIVSSAKTDDEDFTIYRTGLMYYFEKMLNDSGYAFNWEDAFKYAIDYTESEDFYEQVR